LKNEITHVTHPTTFLFIIKYNDSLFNIKKILKWVNILLDKFRTFYVFWILILAKFNLIRPITYVHSTPMLEMTNVHQSLKTSKEALVCSFDIVRYLVIFTYALTINMFGPFFVCHMSMFYCTKCQFKLTISFRAAVKTNFVNNWDLFKKIVFLNFQYSIFIFQCKSTYEKRIG
jgi:hypothetical protein